MDSNDFKNYNSHKFFKLSLNYEKPALSLKNLLTRDLFRVLNLFLQSLTLPFKLVSLDTFVTRQLILLSLERQQKLLKSNNWHLFDKREISFCYSCPIGLVLAPRLQISPQKVVEDLGNLFVRHSSSIEPNPPLYLYADPTGWLNFCVTEAAIACWLKRSLWLLKTQALDNSVLTLRKSDRYWGSNLFCVQYIHARCCSLLRLGAREQLISLVNNDFNYIGWQLTQPRSISWLDPKHHLWFVKQSEYNLLRQLLIVTDSQTVSDNSIWHKLALDISQTTAIFLADCRFLGEIKEQYPQRAIARLGLIALAQCWLQKILVEKLNSRAPTTL